MTLKFLIKAYIYTGLHFMAIDYKGRFIAFILRYDGISFYLSVFILIKALLKYLYISNETAIFYFRESVYVKPRVQCSGNNRDNSQTLIPMGISLKTRNEKKEEETVEPRERTK